MRQTGTAVKGGNLLSMPTESEHKSYRTEGARPLVARKRPSQRSGMQLSLKASKFDLHQSLKCEDDGGQTKTHTGNIAFHIKEPSTEC